MAALSTVRIVSVLPELLGTYGDRGNVVTLCHRLRVRGIPADVVEVHPGDTIPDDGDLYLLGGGEDRSQVVATQLIGRGLEKPVTREATVLAVCAGMQIMGGSFTDSGGSVHSGLGLLDVSTTPLESRAVGEVVVRSPLVSQPLVGFENHRGATYLGTEARPLGMCDTGVGNGDGRDGVIQGSIFGTYLHGPVLALNPEFADFLLSRVVGSLDPMDDRWIEEARYARLR